MKATVNPSNRLNVFVVGDTAEFRRAARNALSSPDISIIGEGNCLDGPAEHEKAQKSDVVLLDSSCVKAGATELQEQVHSLANSGAHVLVMSEPRQHRDANSLRTHAALAMAGGASGYLLKDRGLIKLGPAIQQVAIGRVIVDIRVSQLVFVPSPESRTGIDISELLARASQLSPRERQIMLMIGEGMSNAEIAGQLHISIGTVKTHVAGILRTMKLRDRVHIAIAVADANL